MVVFIVRVGSIHIILAKKMTKKEKKLMKTTKTVPTFKDKNKEREFWEKNDSLDYIDTSKVKKVRFPNLKKRTKTIAILLK